MYLKWSSDYSGENKFVGTYDSLVCELDRVEIMQKGKLVQLNTYYEDASGSGVLLEAANSTTDLGAIDIEWESSDTGVVTVNPYGLVTPVGNGSAWVTARVKNAAALGDVSVSVEFVVDGQSGQYVNSVDIVDETGESITGTVVIASDGRTPEYYQLYARVTWVDADGNVTRTECTLDGALSVDYYWSTAGNTSILYVNSSTGRVATQEAGIGAIVVSVAGGVGGAMVSDTVYFRVDNGQDGNNPADSLTLNVVYEDYPDQVVNSVTYSAAELEGMLPQVTNNYTVIGNSTFATIRATGYMFIDVVKLAGVDLDDILQFRFGTADSYDAPVSYSYLFGSARYYFPNYDINSTAESEVVPPILATASYLVWNASYVSPETELSDGMRYRLVFGVSGRGDSNTSRQVYYINTINIVLKGAPPVQTGTVGGSTDQGGSGGGTGAGTGTGAGSGIQGGFSEGGSGGVSESTGAQDSQLTNTDISGATDAGGDSAGTDAGNDGAWRIYQTMIKSDSNPGTLDFDNPLLVWAPVCAGAVFVFGGVSMYVGYRRRLV